MTFLDPAEVTFTVKEELTALYSFSPLDMIRERARNTSLNSTIRITLEPRVADLGLGLAIQGEPRFTLLSPCCGEVIREVYTICPDSRYYGHPITPENSIPGLVPECNLCLKVFPKGTRAPKGASSLPIAALEAMVSGSFDPLGAAIVAQALDALTTPWARLEPEDLAQLPRILGPGQHNLLLAAKHGVNG